MVAPLTAGPVSVPLCALTPPPRPHVIRVSCLGDAGVCVPELFDKKEDTYAVYHYGSGVPMGHALLAMQEVA